MTQQISLDTQIIRLDRLLSYLQDDPENASLRTDIFDVALQAGRPELAEAQLSFARDAGFDNDSWTMREANLRIAQQRYDDAEHTLNSLQLKMGPHPAIAQNLGLIASLQNNYNDCLAAIKDWVDVSPTTPIEPGLQSMWLRCLHHLHQLDVALNWAEQRLDCKTLHSEALGVTSLIAIDASLLNKARIWSELSLRDNPVLTEALLARATVALSDRDAPLAKKHVQLILERHPGSGRAWSALGFAQMLELDINAARSSLEKATQLMPEHIGTWHGLGWTCLLAKDYAAAQRAFEAALERDRNFGETYGGLAVIAAMQGLREVAEDHLRRAIGLDNKGMSAQYARALLDGILSDDKSILRFARQLMSGRIAPNETQ